MRGELVERPRFGAVLNLERRHGGARGAERTSALSVRWSGVRRRRASVSSRSISGGASAAVGHGPGVHHLAVGAGEAAEVGVP